CFLTPLRALRRGQPPQPGLELVAVSSPGHILSRSHTHHRLLSPRSELHQWFYASGGRRPEPDLRQQGKPLMPVTGVATPPARLVRSYGGLEGRRQAEGRRGPLSPPVVRLGALRRTLCARRCDMLPSVMGPPGGPVVC